MGRSVLSAPFCRKVGKCSTFLGSDESVGQSDYSPKRETRPPLSIDRHVPFEQSLTKMVRAYGRHAKHTIVCGFQLARRWRRFYRPRAVHVLEVMSNWLIRDPDAQPFIHFSLCDGRRLVSVSLPDRFLIIFSIYRIKSICLVGKACTQALHTSLTIHPLTVNLTQSVPEIERYIKS